MDCSPPASSVHGNSPGKNIELGWHALLQGIFPTQESHWGLLHYRWIFFTSRATREAGTYINIADSCHCTVEINTTLQSNYIPLKVKMKKNKRKISRYNTHCLNIQYCAILNNFLFQVSPFIFLLKS